jgi:AcrR family transcriptional regulator
MARRIINGEIRNKERTKLKLINAVGKIIREEGYTKLRVNHIARTAEVSKKLIYRYFDTVDNLIEIYVKGKDYWISLNNQVQELIKQHELSQGKELACITLESLFEHLMNDIETQKIILWEISEKSELMFEISSIREKIGSELFTITDPSFDKTDVDIRAIYAVLLGGIYYLTLHSNATGGSFCEVDIKTNKGKDRINKSLRNIVNWAFTEASKQQSGEKTKNE